MTTTYAYTIAPQRIDEHGVSRDIYTTEADAEEVARLRLADLDYQSAADLPDGVEFARTTDTDGEPIKVYRARA